MGADLIMWNIPTVRGHVDVTLVPGQIRRIAEAEQDMEVLLAVCEWCGLNYDELALEVAMSDPESRKATFDGIEAHYRAVLDEFKESLKWRSVSYSSWGDLWIYQTGGMSYGDAPSDAFSLWDDLFGESDDLWSGNPYAVECWDACGFPRVTTKVSAGEDGRPLITATLDTAAV